MADNETFNNSSAISTTFAFDDIAGVKHQRVKLEHGADGSATDVSAASPLPTVPSTAGDVVSTLTDGRKTITTAGAAQAIRATLACKWVTLTAYKTNAGDIYVGGSGVVANAGSETGTPLSPGDTTTLPVDNAVKVFIDALVDNDGATFTVGSGS